MNEMSSPRFLAMLQLLSDCWDEGRLSLQALMARHIAAFVPVVKRWLQIAQDETKQAPGLFEAAEKASCNADDCRRRNDAPPAPLIGD
ncbi:hypothetical protein JOC55_001931 [Paenibacillus sacheonensis]|nr:hypothetical protein [Paenibacillus sacheonensis]